MKFVGIFLMFVAGVLLASEKPHVIYDALLAVFGGVVYGFAVGYSHGIRQ